MRLWYKKQVFQVDKKIFLQKTYILQATPQGRCGWLDSCIPHTQGRR